MIIAVQGSRNFDDYSIFLRAMGTALHDMDQANDKEVVILSVGPRRINNMAWEFANVSELGFKQRGIKIKVRKVTTSWMSDNIKDVDYFAYFSKPREAVSELVDLAEAKDVEVGVYRY